VDAKRAAEWRQHLAIAERHVAQGEMTIKNQKGIIATLERQGQGSAAARAILDTFEQTQRIQQEHRDYLARLLNLDPLQK
jgi:hypothetical protein